MVELMEARTRTELDALGCYLRSEFQRKKAATPTDATAAAGAESGGEMHSPGRRALVGDVLRDSDLIGEEVAGDTGATMSLHPAHIPGKSEKGSHQRRQPSPVSVLRLGAGGRVLLLCGAVTAALWLAGLKGGVPMGLGMNDQIKLGQQAGDWSDDKHGLNGLSTDAEVNPLVRGIGQWIAQEAKPPDHQYVSLVGDVVLRDTAEPLSMRLTRLPCGPPTPQNTTRRPPTRLRSLSTGPRSLAATQTPARLSWSSTATREPTTGSALRAEIARTRSLRCRGAYTP
jgi:hypothetical protein